jgi:hypothetical protein
MRLWRTNLPAYSEAALTVKNKVGDLVKLSLNQAQLHCHRMLERQKAETGMVRAIILKGRQQGISTYIQARFYWLTSLWRGLRAQILTHRQDSTDHLFGMAERFWRFAPVRPELSASNAKELSFAGIESGYQVATAGAKGVGRASSCQLFHGSEVAWWENGADHMAGMGQIVPDLRGTEIILESTANGIGGVFHGLWQAAERRESSYRAVFVPWHWQPEYTRDATAFVPSDEELEYQRVHRLKLGQMAWRRAKIQDDFSGDLNRWAQEYPATPAEAFVAVGHDAFITPSLVAAARGRMGYQVSDPMVVGVDPARFGANKTTIARRRGRQCQPLERLSKKDTMHVAGRILLLIREERPLRVFIDVGGLGAGIYDRLVELGYGDVVTAVNFGETASRDDRFVNKRAEIWADMKTWLALGDIPEDDQVLAADLVGPTYKYDSRGRLQLEKKEDMMKRGVASPDSGDALALTFAMPVAFRSNSEIGGRAWEDMIDAFNRVETRDGAVEGIHTG